MQVTQSIQTPLGINVFGSATMRISPNVVSLSFSVENVADHPRDAFRITHESAQQVRAYLSEANIAELGVSHIQLNEAIDYVNGQTKFLGYRATLDFNVLIMALNQLEEILSGLVDAGINRISGVSYQTTELKEIRAEARRRAVKAAHDKAQLYCNEAGVALGKVIHLEDINPDVLSQFAGHHTVRETPIDDEGPVEAYDPGSIIVKAAVMVTFEIAASD
jgi:uncharacterized protein YggE